MVSQTPGRLRLLVDGVEVHSADWWDYDQGIAAAELVGLAHEAELDAKLGHGDRARCPGVRHGRVGGRSHGVRGRLGHGGLTPLASLIGAALSGAWDTRSEL